MAGFKRRTDGTVDPIKKARARSFIMSKLAENNISFKYEVVNNVGFIYIHGKETEIVTFEGVTKKYTPELRLSHFGEKDDMVYVRDCGLCEYEYIDRVIEKAKNYMKGRI